MLLVGMKGSGISTWIRTQVKPEVYIDLEDAEKVSDLTDHPELIEELLPKGNALAVIDEVSAAPKLARLLFSAAASRNAPCIITASDTLLLRDGAYQQYPVRYMHPLTAAEFGDDFSLETSLKFGHLCTAQRPYDKITCLNQYVSTAVMKKIDAHRLVKRPEIFSKFLIAAAMRHGEVPSISSAARECGISRQTASAWFSLLTELLIGAYLPVQTLRGASHDRQFYFTDAGLYQVFRPRGILDELEVIGHAARRGLLFQEVRAWCEYLLPGARMFSWRADAESTADIAVEHHGTLKAFHTAHDDDVRPCDLKGLEAFGRAFPDSQRYLLLPEGQKDTSKSITVVPMAEALRQLPVLLTS